MHCRFPLSPLWGAQLSSEIKQNILFLMRWRITFTLQGSARQPGFGSFLFKQVSQHAGRGGGGGCGGVTSEKGPSGGYFTESFHTTQHLRETRCRMSKRFQRMKWGEVLARGGGVLAPLPLSPHECVPEPGLTRQLVLRQPWLFWQLTLHYDIPKMEWLGLWYFSQYYIKFPRFDRLPDSPRWEFMHVTRKLGKLSTSISLSFVELHWTYLRRGKPLLRIRLSVIKIICSTRHVETEAHLMASNAPRAKRFSCDHSGCKKSYLRPEHLNRHRLTRKSWVYYIS